MPLEMVVKPEFKLRGCIKDGVACVFLTLETPAGPFTLQGCFPLYQAAKMIRAWAEKRGVKYSDLKAKATASGADETGGFFSKMRSLTKKVALAKALAPLLKSAQQISQNPILARAVGLTTVVVPGLGSQAKALQTATSLVTDAMRGKLKAKDALRKIKDAALRGVPQAQEALKLAKIAAKAVVEKNPVDMLKGVTAEVRQAASQITAPVNQALAMLPGPARMAAEAALQASPAGMPFAALRAVASGEDRAAAEYQFHAANAARPVITFPDVYARLSHHGR